MKRKPETNFAILLKQKRKNAGLTQSRMSSALNLKRSTYAYYEIGRTLPSIKTINKISKVLGIDMSVFINAIVDDESDITTLSPDSYKEHEKFYNLKDDEQDIILAYRLLSTSRKSEIKNLMKKG